MKDLDDVIGEIASTLSKETISAAKTNTDTLLNEVVNCGAALMKMIAWDQQ